MMRAALAGVGAWAGLLSNGVCKKIRCSLQLYRARLAWAFDVSVTRSAR